MKEESQAKLVVVLEREVDEPRRLAGDEKKAEKKNVIGKSIGVRMEVIDILRVFEIKGERKGSKKEEVGKLTGENVGDQGLSGKSWWLAGGWKELLKKADFFIIYDTERGGILEFQSGETKKTLGFPDNDVVVDIINADDIVADLRTFEKNKTFQQLISQNKLYENLFSKISVRISKTVVWDQSLLVTAKEGKKKLKGLSRCQ